MEQISRKFFRGLIPISRRSGECSTNDFVDVGWQVPPEGRRARRRLGESSDETLFSRERRFAGQHLEQDAAETIGIASAIQNLVSHQLLGTHVSRGAGTSHARLRELHHAGDVDHPGDSKVRENRVPSREQDVLRLDVAMNDSLRVSVPERFGDLASDAARGFHWQLFFPVDAPAKRLPGHVGHHVIEKGIHVSGIVEGKNVGVLEPGENPDLPNESELSGFRVGVGVEDLERDLPFVLEVAGEVYGRERSLPDLALDFVMSTKRGAQWRKGIERWYVAQCIHRIGRLEHSTPL